MCELLPCRLAWCVAVLCCVVEVRARGDDQRVHFLQEVAPILVQRCQGCHGAKQSDSNYRLDTAELLQKSGDFGEAIVTPGSLEQSLLWRLVSSQDDGERMPKDGEPLPASELNAIRQWIEQGAELDVPEMAKPLAPQLPRPPYRASPAEYRSPTPVTALAWDTSGEQLIVGGYRELTVWNVADATLHHRVPHVTERTAALVLSPDGKLMAIAGGTPGAYGEVRLLDSHDGTEVRFLGMTSDVVLGISFRPDGQEVAAAFPDQTIRIYDVAAGTQRLKLESHADWVTSVAWSPDGKRLVSGSRDKTAKVFESDSGNLVATYSGHGASVGGVVFSPDGSFVFSCGDDKKIHFWKADDGSKSAIITAHTDAVHRVALAHGALWSASADRTALQYKLEDRSVVQRFADHPDWVTALALHPDGKLLATGCLSGHVRVSNCSDGATRLEFLAAPGYAVSGSVK